MSCRADMSTRGGRRPATAAMDEALRRAMNGMAVSRPTSPAKGHLGARSASPLTVHDKERCPGCGLWKRKHPHECKFCLTRPNVKQAQRAMAKHPALPRSPSSPERVVHTKERCPGCGLWKPKDRLCEHCVSRPNRAQASRAQQRQSPQEIIRIGSGSGWMVVEPGHAGRHYAAKPPDTQGHAARLHTKERCHGCGLWKSKEYLCSFCLTRPNRMQAFVAQQRNFVRPTSAPLDDYWCATLHLHNLTLMLTLSYLIVTVAAAILPSPPPSPRHDALSVLRHNRDVHSPKRDALGLDIDELGPWAMLTDATTTASDGDA